MAHTDACKIQVCQFVEICTERGMSVNKACLEAEKESDGIPAETVRSWWYESQKETKKVVENSTPTPTTGNNEEKQENQVEEPKHGGSRKGSGRKPKGQATLSYQEVTEALDFAIIAISQLERIRADDPKRFEAFDKVILWIETRKEDMQNGR